MARARNIKPSFFANDDLADIDPLGRLLFIGLWTLADREGRLEDRPRRIKAEVLPYDGCDVDGLLQDLNKYGFILRYEVDGERFIQVLNFTKHQNPHVKESASQIPAPGQHSASTGQEQCKQQPDPEQAGLIPDSGFPLTDSPSQGERVENDGVPSAPAEPSPPAAQSSRAPRATRLPKDWALPDSWLSWALCEQPSWTPAVAQRVADLFRDYWHAKGGADARKVCWEATWRNWVRREKTSDKRGPNSGATGFDPLAYVNRGRTRVEQADVIDV